MDSLGQKVQLVGEQKGLKIPRLFTKSGENVYNTCEWEKRTSIIKNPDGSIVFQMNNVEVPKFWSQTATDILAQKYFRKKGVPQFDDKGNPILDANGQQVLGSETSLKQVVHRLAGCWTWWGKKYNYFATEEDAQAFYDEVAYMLLHQFAAPNSPQWFNTGLNFAYGITGSPQGHWYVDPDTKELTQAKDAYSHIQAHACFIQPVKDDLVNEGGILDLAVREARIFKYGSGCTSENSYVYTDKFGLIKISELFEKFKHLGINDFDGKGKFIDISNLGIHTISMNKDGVLEKDLIEKIWQYDVSKEDKLKVYLSNGSRVVVSSWHPFLVWNGETIEEKRADELKRGDVVLSSNSSIKNILPEESVTIEWRSKYKKIENHSIELDKDLAWLIGYFIGDGSIDKRKYKIKGKLYEDLRLRFSGETITSLKKAKKIIKEKFGDYSRIVSDKRKNSFILNCVGRKATSFFVNITKSNKTYSIGLPEFILKSNLTIIYSFLAGLIDSDGYVTKDGKTKYATTSKLLAEKLSVLSSLLGLGGGIVKNGNTYTVTLIAKSNSPEIMKILINLSNVDRRTRLNNFLMDNRRKCFTMPLSDEMFGQIFNAPTNTSGWLSYSMGLSTFSLSRLKYEGVVNPVKQNRMLFEVDKTETSEFLKRISESATFVESVEKIDDDPEFFDLTVKKNNNYLAGEHGLVIIHNTGTNFSTLRAKGEPLSGGGTSSGVMSFLKIYDTIAGSIKSGGTTRRAAKMVILNIDHPEIEAFIRWKADEEKKFAALVSAGLVDGYSVESAGEHVFGQNSNNSVRVTNDFMKAVIEDKDWNLTWRTDGRVVKTVKARYLWDMIAQAAWECADPGLQFDTTYNEWHTSPASGRINATNPCSEFAYLDNSACNLASLNLVKFLENGIFNVDAFKHAVRLWTIVLEISILMAQFPSKEIAEVTYKTRSLGLGYTNLGSLLMRLGIPYDSDKARAIAAAITAIMTGETYATSAELASFLGPFEEFEKNREHMLRVIRNHRRVVYNAPKEEYEGLSIIPPGIDHTHCPDYLLKAAIECWDRALLLGEKYGYRNAQATLIAPTGTISFVMDADTTGVEPDFALVKFKKLVGGGYFKIVNQSVAPALRTLGYTEEQIKDIIRYLVGTNRFEGAPYINTFTLKRKGFTDEDIIKMENLLPSALDLSFVFNVNVLGKECLERLGFKESQYSSSDFNLLKALGFRDDEIDAATEFICGAQTIEGAPHLKIEHYAVFDCAVKCGKKGTRDIDYMAQVYMMAAIQPLLSGSISKTINMPNHATVEDIQKVYLESWKLGLKSLAIYRDGSKIIQPLSVFKEKKEEFKPVRRRLPAERQAIAHKFRVGNQEGYLHVGLFEDGSPGELFVTIAKQGSTLAGLMDAFALTVSISLQYGVPLKVLVSKFINTRFEPMGWTDNPEI
ncbi:MAG: adenosylcobalamin-dependent ribonucleoside-diphosphate reductase, partial [Candidatus Aenigmatarchaeota archaeon]